MRIDREEKAARAEALFREGYNCAQSVVLAYVQEMGLETQTAARLSSGFGGGVGGLRSVCGTQSLLIRIPVAPAASAVRKMVPIFPGS